MAYIVASSLERISLPRSNLLYPLFHRTYRNVKVEGVQKSDTDRYNSRRDPIGPPRLPRLQEPPSKQSYDKDKQQADLRNLH